MIRRSHVAAASAAVVLAVAASAQAALLVGGINSAVVLGVQVPNATAGVSVGTNLQLRVMGNDAGGVATVGSVTGISGSSTALFGKKDQASNFGVGRAPALTFSANPAIFAGLDSSGNGALVGPIASVQSAVVNNTAVATAGGAKPAIGGTTATVWGASFDNVRISTGGTVFVVGRDGTGGNLIMGKYSGYAASGAGGTWSPALAAGDTILAPNGSPFGTLPGATSAGSTFDPSMLRVADVSGTPTYITRAAVNPTPTGGQVSALIANGKILASPGGAAIVSGSVPAGYAGTTYSSFAAVDIASNGNFAYGGNTAGISNSFVAVNGTVVAKGGDVVAGVTLATGTGNVAAVDVNEAGDLAFLYGTGSGSGRALFLKTSDGDVLVAQQTISSVGIDTDGNGAPNSSVLLNTLTLATNNLYLSPRYTAVNGAPSVDIYFGGNGTGASPLNANAIFKATVAVPEPAALGLLAPAALALVARRRRNA